MDGDAGPDLFAAHRFGPAGVALRRPVLDGAVAMTGDLSGPDQSSAVVARGATHPGVPIKRRRVVGR
jgi:hypothetical protein